MAQSPNALHLEQLAREDVTVNRALYLYKCGQCSYEQALELAVIELAAQNAMMLEALTQAALRAPPPVLLVQKVPS